MIISIIIMIMIMIMIIITIIIIISGSNMFSIVICSVSVFRLFSCVC